VSKVDKRFGIYGRPQDQLLDYPLKYRWEFTRRHPYYLVCWQLAKAHLQGSTAHDAKLDAVCHVALQLLRHIGVTGEPADPATPFEELDAGIDVDPGLLAGAVQPMTCGMIVAGLIAALPHAELVKVANLMDAATGAKHAVPGDDEVRTHQRLKVSGAVSSVNSAALNSYFDIPLFYVHLAASQRSIVNSMERQVRQWKRRRGIKETRQQTKKFDAYLDIWDARVGWTGSGYDYKKRCSLKDVAKIKRKSLSTVQKQYSSAFELITGHPYSPERWVRIVAPIFADNKELAEDCVRRFNNIMQSESVSIVTETTLKGPNKCGERSIGFMGNLPDSADQDAKDSMTDAVIMIKEGKNNGEITALLRIPGEVVDLIRGELSGE
jgi:hypothetical protein